ncbi:bifunctional protein-serine/threonine kinase/phosphatase [Candidatus Colwellia aromaticivorans]|uniref:bifunctional protein-serine/threonine kinase/phosphatase n=1 Tax=Candidatus Colwellia aromaticivorans TaxID=2267621 RepID=UPI000DF37171|nr:bifunctional protein-serine/threonine kinase/phosphatase [Candidatus Colwellia aromaticivorans]
MTEVAKTKNDTANNKLTDKLQSTVGLQVKFGGYSCAGIKAENQDAFAALVPPKENDLISKGVIACIADGVSSADKAAEASQLAVTQFISDYYSTPPTWSTQKSAAKVITSLNQWLYSQKSSALDEDHYLSSQRQQWLTTFSSMILKSATGYIFHVGDTRITLYRNKQLEALSQDHNCKQGHKSVILTRALGADSRLQVDVHQVSLQKNDIYLLTCDGVHEFLTKKQVTTLLNTLSSEPDNLELERLSKALVEQALAAGSDDNVSCLLVMVTNLPNKQLAEIETELRKKAIPPALEIGQTLDSFKIKKIIHASNRSHVYLVEDSDTGETLTLKTPSANFTEDALYLQAFFREAWLGERINHVNVMATKPFDNNSKFLYHISEYIDGQTLTQWMYDNPHPSIGQVRDIIKQIISALRAFQRLEVVHRDLKPDNIMIDQYGQIKLIDYGAVFVASLDENQETLLESVPQGSVNYIAPETLLTMKANHLSDLFSLGVICYEMLTGELPYKPNVRANNNYTHYQQWHYRSIKQHRNDLPLWLDLTLQQATQANPNLRPQVFSEFYANLSKPNIEAIDEYKSQPLIQRNPVKFWQGTSLVLFICLMLSLFY